MSDPKWRHRSGSTLTQVMVCYMITPSHRLNQCWLIIIEVLWHLGKSNFVGKASLDMNLKMIESRLQPFLSTPTPPVLSSGYEGWVSTLRIRLFESWLSEIINFDWCSSVVFRGKRKCFVIRKTATVHLRATGIYSSVLLTCALLFNGKQLKLWANCFTVYLMSSICIQFLP